MKQGIQGLDHVALPVADLPRAVEFYRDALGMRSVDSKDPEDADYYWLNFGPGQTVNLLHDPENTPGTHDSEQPPHVAFSASEDDLRELRDRLDDRGVDVRETETSIYFTDPDGNALEVTCWREKRLRETGRDHW